MNTAKKLLSVVMVIIMTLSAVPLGSVQDKSVLPSFAVTAQAASKKKIRVKKKNITITTGTTYTQKLLDKKGKTISASKVKWKSSGKKIAKINKNGKITAVKKGKVTMTATYKGKKYKFTVTVKNASFKQKKMYILVGKSSTQKLLGADGKVIDASEITWKSSNKKIAKVNSAGKVTAVKKGTATITATYKGKKYKFTVQVRKTPKLTLSENGITLYKGGGSKTLKVTAIPSDVKIKWKTSDKKVVKVNSKGKLTPVATGKATITAQIKYKNKTYKDTCKVTVEPKSATLANSITPRTYPTTPDSVYFQSLYKYAWCDFKYEAPGANSQKFIHVDNTLEPRDDIASIEEYVNLLCNNMNFRLVNDYYFEYRGEAFFEYNLDYTGTANVPRDQSALFDDEFTDKFAIQIWGKMMFGKLEHAYINWSTGLRMVDMGYRDDGSRVPTAMAMAGLSAHTGAVRNLDTFSTSDGRFSVKAGEAMSVVGTEKYFTEAVYYIDTAKKTESICIDGYYESNGLKILFPLGSLKTGLIYELSDFATGSETNRSSEPMTVDSKAEFYTSDGTGSWRKPGAGDVMYSDLTFRVMYKDADKAVIYIYYDWAAETEIFCVVDLKQGREDEKKRIKAAEEEKKKAEEEANKNQGSSGSSGSFGSSGNGRCTRCGGRGFTTCITCNGSGYVTHYVSTPNYSGRPGGGGSSTVTKRCPSVSCNNGRKDCPYC